MQENDTVISTFVDQAGRSHVPYEKHGGVHSWQEKRFERQLVAYAQDSDVDHMTRLIQFHTFVITSVFYQSLDGAG